MIVNASKIRVGDTVATWWRPGRDTVMEIEPYTGPLEELAGGWLFKFAICDGMTAAPGDTFDRLATGRGAGE